MRNLSNPQKSIWLTEQFARGTGLNNVSGNIIIQDIVDLKSLEKALNIYVQKNEAIRTIITLDNEVPKQYIQEYKPFKLDIVNLKDENDLTKFNEEIVRKPFELLNSPLFRFTLFKFKDGSGGLNVTFHHIISDAWTMSLFIDETIKIYSELINSISPDMSINYSYIDYLNSEDEYIKTNKFLRDKDFWEKLFEFEPESSYITNINKNNTEIVAKRKIFKLPSSIHSKIINFCKDNNISIFTFFMSLYLIYLSKLNNNTNPIVGTPVLNRSGIKEKHTAGMFISTIPFSFTVIPEINFLSFVKNVSTHQMSIFRHQKYPYQLLLEHVKSKFDTNENLYDIALSYQNARDNKSNSDVNYYTQWLFSGYTLDTLDVHFYDMDNTGNFDIYYDYQISQLNETDIINIHNRIVNMAMKVIENPTITINNIEIITPSEKNIVTDFNNTSIAYNKNKSLISVFEDIVKKYPNKPAVIFENTVLTYSELNTKANILANYILSKNIPKNSVIGIMMNRCTSLQVAIIGCLKSGNAYMLIDPELPLDRVSYMLENSNAPILIQNSAVNKIEYKDVLNIDSLDYSNSTISNPCIPSNNLDTHCIIYTSGSTGKPKGVALTKLGVINLVLSYKKFLYTDNCNVFLSISTVAFDMFIVENFVCLLSGKTLILANEDEQKLPDLMSNLIIKHGVDFILSTPSKLELLLFNTYTKNSLKNLKVIQLRW